jgi:hypothetical protein
MWTERRTWPSRPYPACKVLGVEMGVPDQMDVMVVMEQLVLLDLEEIEGR